VTHVAVGTSKLNINLVTGSGWMLKLILLISWRITNFSGLEYTTTKIIRILHSSATTKSFRLYSCIMQHLYANKATRSLELAEPVFRKLVAQVSLPKHSNFKVKKCLYNTTCNCQSKRMSGYVTLKVNSILPHALLFHAQWNRGFESCLGYCTRRLLSVLCYVIRDLSMGLSLSRAVKLLV
jgi:hypothetical protein